MKTPALVLTFSTKQGLISDAVVAVLGATDGSVWLAAREGLMREQGGRRHGRGALHPVTQRVCENARSALAVSNSQVSERYLS
jgi:hypothetical protein